MHQYHINSTKKKSLIHIPQSTVQSECVQEVVVSNCMRDKTINTNELFIHVFIHCSYPLPRLLSSENHLAVVY
jgi:hypothetical protein